MCYLVQVEGVASLKVFGEHVLTQWRRRKEVEAAQRQH
jgi:hypothetical protein